MSIRIMTLVWETDCPSLGAKLVLLALADNASDEGIAWPAISTIAHKCSMSERTVSRHIVVLKQEGHLSITERSGTSNLYHVHPSSAGRPGQNVASALADLAPARNDDQHTRDDQPKTEPLPNCHTTPDNLASPPLPNCHTTPANLASPPLTDCHGPLTDCQVTPDRLSPKPSRTVTEPRDSSLSGRGGEVKIPDEAIETIDAILRTYPKSRGKEDARRTLFEVWKSGEDLNDILERVKAIAEVIAKDYSEADKLRFVPAAYKFFGGREWLSDPADWRQAKAIEREQASAPAGGGGWSKSRLNQEQPTETLKH